MNGVRLVLVAGVVAGVVTACAPNGDDEGVLAGYAMPDAMPVADRPALPDAGPDTDADTGPAPTLNGTFAVLARVHVKVVVDLYLRQFFVMEWRQDPDDRRRLHQRFVTCGIELPSFMGVVTLSFPPAVVELLQGAPVSQEGAFLGEPGPGATWRPEPIVTTLGVDTTGVDPATVTLPTAADPGRAVDQDADGHPGVTVSVDTATCPGPAQLYVAFRTTAAFDGRVETRDTLAGGLTPTLEQAILGRSHDCLAVASALRIEVQDDSTFRAVRVADTGEAPIGCAELADQWDTLFPPESE